MYLDGSIIKEANKKGLKNQVFKRAWMGRYEKRMIFFFPLLGRECGLRLSVWVEPVYHTVHNCMR